MESNLNAADIKILRRMIRYEFKMALVRVIEIEEAARPGEDAPREGRVAKKEKWNILEFLAQYFPYVEGAMRGMQLDVGKNNDKIWKDLTPSIESIRAIMLTHENDLKKIAEFSEKIKPLLELVDEGNFKGRHYIEADNRPAIGGGGR